MKHSIYPFSFRCSIVYSYSISYIGIYRNWKHYCFHYLLSTCKCFLPSSEMNIAYTTSTSILDVINNIIPATKGCPIVYTSIAKSINPIIDSTKFLSADKNSNLVIYFPLVSVVGHEGLEPPTPWVEAKCSSPLS